MASMIAHGGMAPSQYLMRGWGWSVLLHLGVLTAVAVLGPKMASVVEPEPFQWDVALIQPASEQPQIESTPVPSAQVIGGETHAAAAGQQAFFAGYGRAIYGGVTLGLF